MIGFFEKSEYEIFRDRVKPFTLVGEREVDNPVVVFDRLARESGAESFFPSSERDLRQALARISSILDAEYTLAYYPGGVNRFRKIQVKVKRGGVRVLSRHGAGAETGDAPVHFQVSSCEVSAKEHPYPWESRTVRSQSGALIYSEDFSDPRTGWPNRSEQPLRGSNGGLYLRPGVRYIKGGYELSRLSRPVSAVPVAPFADGVVAAYGPWWDDFRASVLVEAGFSSADAGHIFLTTTPALVFHLGAAGYYALVLKGPGTGEFKLIRRTFSPGAETVILPWTKVVSSVNSAEIEKKQRKLSVQYSHGRIDIEVDDRPAGTVEDTMFPNGLIGLALFGGGRAVFHDLMVEGLP